LKRRQDFKLASITDRWAKTTKFSGKNMEIKADFSAMAQKVNEPTT